MPLSKVKKNTLTVLLSIEMLTAYTVSLFSSSGIIETIFNKFVKKFSIWGDNSNIHVVQIHEDIKSSPEPIGQFQTNFAQSIYVHIFASQGSRSRFPLSSPLYKMISSFNYFKSVPLHLWLGVRNYRIGWVWGIPLGI